MYGRQTAKNKTASVASFKFSWKEEIRNPLDGLQGKQFAVRSSAE